MQRRIERAFAICAVLAASGCTSIPRMVVARDTTPIEHSLYGGPRTPIATTVSDAAPAGPKVASLIGNLRCELLEAANSQTELPFYKHGASGVYVDNSANADTNPARIYNLRNIFQNVRYVGQITLQLDVTDTSSINPNATLSNVWRAAAPLLPATGGVLAISGQLSESPHRQIQLNETVDFNRLVGPHSVLAPRPNATEAASVSDAHYLAWPGKPVLTAADAEVGGQPDAAVLQQELSNAGCDPRSAGAGHELNGNLGLKEVLATGMIAATASDIALFPSGQTTSGDQGGTTPVISVANNNTFGVISATVDFTIVENLNGGPTWTLRYLKGPGGSPLGLVNLNRQVKDSIQITFIPVCVRSRYIDYVDSHPGAGPYEYRADFGRNRELRSDPNATTTRPSGDEVLPDGTPGWVNYLPPCKGVPQIGDIIPLKGLKDRLGHDLMSDKTYLAWAKLLSVSDGDATSPAAANNTESAGTVDRDAVAAAEQAKIISTLSQLGTIIQSGPSGP
jgi:hypothetical protein